MRQLLIATKVQKWYVLVPNFSHTLAAMIDPVISVSGNPSDDDLRTIRENLTAFNRNDVGPDDMRPLAVVARNEDEAVVGGVVGNTAWGWLYVQWLWIAETERGKGLAAKMLAAAETEAISRGCGAAYIDTFNPVARRVYEKAGYTAFGQLEDFPKGRDRVFLQKKL